MKKILILGMLTMLVVSFASCGSKDIAKDITNVEVQNIRNILADEWKFTDEYIEENEENGVLKDLTIVILDTGNWVGYKKNYSYLSEGGDYYIDFAYDDKYSVVFTFDNSTDTVSCFYSEETDNLFQMEETIFTITIAQVMERK